MDQVAFAGSTKEEAKEEAQVKLEKSKVLVFLLFNFIFEVWKNSCF